MPLSVPSSVPPTVPADTIRLARAADAPAVVDLIEHSCLALAHNDEERRHAHALLDAGLAAQQRPIREGTCFVAECGSEIIGVCAWSGRRDVAEAARVRALAVHPGHPPLALARLMLVLCESAAARQGFDWLEAITTRPQAWVYFACGFGSAEPSELPCPRDVTVPCLLVRKPIGSHPRPAHRPPRKASLRI
jgi:N-acetylglutamate synthase-like GNAT family acetyltransferase